MIIIIVVAVIVFVIALILELGHSSSNKVVNETPKPTGEIVATHRNIELEKAINENYYAYRIFMLENSSRYGIMAKGHYSADGAIVNDGNTTTWVYHTYCGLPMGEKPFDFMIKSLRGSYYSKMTAKDADFYERDLLFAKHMLAPGTIISCGNRAIKTPEGIVFKDVKIEVIKVVMLGVLSRTTDGCKVDFWGWHNDGLIETSYIKFDEFRYYKYDDVKYDTQTGLFK